MSPHDIYNNEYLILKHPSFHQAPLPVRINKNKMKNVIKSFFHFHLSFLLGSGPTAAVFYKINVFKFEIVCGIDANVD